MFCMVFFWYFVGGILWQYSFLKWKAPSQSPNCYHLPTFFLVLCIYIHQPPSQFSLHNTITRIALVPDSLHNPRPFLTAMNTKTLINAIMTTCFFISPAIYGREAGISSTGNVLDHESTVHSPIGVTSIATRPSPMEKLVLFLPAMH